MVNTVFTKQVFCPRCDRQYVGEGPTQEVADKAANNRIREHLKIQVDELHDGALEAWDDDGV